MFETIFNQELDYTVTDSTVYVNPGTVRMGNTIMPFRGDRILFSEMADFGDQTNKYQYSALVLNDYNTYPDLTSSVSTPVDSTRELIYPELESDSSNPYAPVYAVGLFLFHTPDGTAIDLISSSRINPS